ncbi:MAG TPA: PH domain-containing protein [Candidatus Hydromicrobium sp.]
MNEHLLYDEEAQNMGYFPFMEPGEKTVFTAPGILDNIINGYLVLTDKKIFFYFYSNIARDKKFIATYPYIISASLKEGLIYSTLVVSSKKESIKINKIKKKDALKFYKILNEIIKDNKK